MTTVLTTHYLEEAERLADQVHIIDHGRLIASGTPFELTRGTGTSTIRLVVTRAVPRRTRRRRCRRCSGRRPRCTRSTSTACSSPAPPTPTTLGKVSAWCEEVRRAARSRSASGQRTLEDVFLQLTGREFRARDRHLHPAARAPRRCARQVAAPRPGWRRGCCSATASSCCWRSSSRCSCCSPACCGIEYVDLSLSHTADRRADPRRARAGGDVDRASRRWRSRPASSGGTACSSGSAPRRCPGTGCCSARSARCSSSRLLQVVVIGGVALLLGWSPELTAARRRRRAGHGRARHGRVRLARAASSPAPCGPRRRSPPRTSSTSCSPPAAGSCCRRRRTARFADVVALLPSGALGGGLREALLRRHVPARPGAGPAGLGGASGTLLTARTFKWE